MYIIIACVLVGVGMYAYIRSYPCKSSTRVVALPHVKEWGYKQAATDVATQMTDPWCVSPSCQRSAELERRCGRDRRTTSRGTPDRRKQ